MVSFLTWHEEPLSQVKGGLLNGTQCTHHVDNIVESPLGLASLVQNRLSDVLIDDAAARLGHLHCSLEIAQLTQ